jgi:hypothetical protein
MKSTDEVWQRIRREKMGKHGALQNANTFQMGANQQRVNELS